MRKIIVYLIPDSPYCLKTKELFEKNQVKFTEIDVKKDEIAWKEMVRKSGQIGVPVIQIDDEIIIGYDEPKLRDILKLSK